MRVHFQENLLFSGWAKLLGYAALSAFVIATSGGRLEPSVLFGMIFGLGFYVFQRHVTRGDFDILVEHLTTAAGALPAAEWPLPPPQAALVQQPAAAGFGRRRRSPFED